MHLGEDAYAKTDNRVEVTCNRELERTRPATIEEMVDMWLNTKACEQG